ncbi:hypothetical protein OVV87_27945, partial [Klebsiella pneumoniae]|nr:hypothetical protein [Klebsiella pneumoniae]
KTGSFGPYGCPENLSVRFFPNSAGSPRRKLYEYRNANGVKISVKMRSPEHYAQSGEFLMPFSLSSAHDSMEKHTLYYDLHGDLRNVNKPNL